MSRLEEADTDNSRRGKEKDLYDSRSYNTINEYLQNFWIL